MAYVAVIFEGTVFIYRDASSTPLVTLAMGADTTGYLDHPDVRMAVESAGGHVAADLKEILFKEHVYAPHA